MGEPPKYTPEDKLHWEVENLRREVEAKSRHPALTPAFWFSLAGTLMALVAAVAQYFASNLEYREANIRKARAELDLAQNVVHQAAPTVIGQCIWPTGQEARGTHRGASPCLDRDITAEARPAT